MKTFFLLISLIFASFNSHALSSVIEHQTNKPLNETYDALYKSLEENRFWVVFEANMGKRLNKMQANWGEDYNKNKLTGIRSMVFCNINWTHKLANADPKSLVLCPLHLTLYSQDEKTHILMPKLSDIVKGSSAVKEATELENQLQQIILDTIGQ